jgi:aromatic ring-cleaving dioxygenase
MTRHDVYDMHFDETDFASWLQQHREIRSVLSRKTLD